MAPFGTMVTPSQHHPRTLGGNLQLAGVTAEAQQLVVVAVAQVGGGSPVAETGASLPAVRKAGMWLVLPRRSSLEVGAKVGQHQSARVASTARTCSRPEIVRLGKSLSQWYLPRTWTQGCSATQAGDRPRSGSTRPGRRRRQLVLGTRMMPALKSGAHPHPAFLLLGPSQILILDLLPYRSQQERAMTPAPTLQLTLAGEP